VALAIGASLGHGTAQAATPTIPSSCRVGTIVFTECEVDIDHVDLGHR
jgi:hypothetical protein